MNFCDYHLHSEFSFDSSEKIENICAKALQEGISEIAITDHAEFPVSTHTPFPNLELRNSTIEKCRKLYPHLTVLSGLEIGQPWQGEISCDVYSSLDFVIASVHSLDGYQNINYSEMSSNEVKSFLEGYLNKMISMAKWVNFDVLGHVTYLFRFLSEEMIKEYPPESFKDAYAELFTTVIGRGKGIEVNCSGLRMPTIENTLPSPELIKLYRDLGGEIITVGSDGHSCRSAFSGIKKGYGILASVGYKHVAVYRKHNVSFFKLEAIN